MNQPAAQPSRAEAMIAMTHVEKWYGEFKALTDISLTVRKGERIVLCGPSGSGKSTLIRCINHLETYQKGEIRVGGTVLDHRAAKIDAVRREVGMVFQHFNLFPHLTVLENCMLAPMRSLGASKAEAEATAIRLLARVKIAEQAQKYPSHLSGGQQQRVAIARHLHGFRRDRRGSPAVCVLHQSAA
jgi:polar amino acid transport system ATP-binding protein